MPSVPQILRERFAALQPPNQNKIRPLEKAVRIFLRPGMKIGFAGRPSAAVYEICRQFRDQRPGFEYISSTLTGSMLPLVHLRLLKKAVTSFAGDGYPTPGPSPVIARALDRGELEIENWTMLTICQRLLAGALGVPYLTTRSMVGSSLADEIPESFREGIDPFGGAEKVGMVKAYQPDIAFAHVWAADQAGNSLSFPPFGENVYGALGAREGVVLTAERIVDTDFIRCHSDLARIPAEKVLSVSHVPYGAHPSGVYVRNVAEFEPYGNDYAFWREHREAQKTKESYSRWVNEWILSVPDHQSYMERLGLKRLGEICGAADPESWRADVAAYEETLMKKKPAGAIERMVILASREIARRMLKEGYRAVLCGIGQATLASILAWQHLRDDGHDFALMAELGFYNYDPRPADPYIFNFRNIPASTMLSDIFEILGIHMGGSTNRCMGVIGAAQIDRHGNVNSVRMNGKFIIGSGGANDIATSARQTLVVAQQNPGQFAIKAEHITCPGERIRCVVTTKGRYEKNEDGELVLTGYFPLQGENEEEAVRGIREMVDWDLRVSPDLERFDSPGEDDLALLRLYDPERHFIGKTEKK